MSAQHCAGHQNPLTQLQQKQPDRVFMCRPHRWALADARDRGVPVADDIGFDSTGEATTDPGRIIDGGAIQVFDRYIQLALRIIGTEWLSISLNHATCPMRPQLNPMLHPSAMKGDAVTNAGFSIALLVNVHAFE